MTTPEKTLVKSVIDNIPDDSPLKFLEFIEEIIDDIMINSYGDYRLRERFSDYSNRGENEKMISVLQTYMLNILLSESYNLSTIYGTLNLDYNPIENYRMTEESGDTHTNDIGKRMTTGTNTAQPVTTIATNTEYEVPGNVTSEYETRKNIQQIENPQSVVDTSSTQEAVQDTIKITHNLTRSGNIGVTTSQQMIQSEREIANINFCDIVINMLLDNICEGVLCAI